VPSVASLSIGRFRAAVWILFLLRFDRYASYTVDLGSITMGLSMNISHAYLDAIPTPNHPVLKVLQQTEEFKYSISVEPHKRHQTIRTPTKTNTCMHACSCMTQLLPYLTQRTAHTFVHLQSAEPLTESSTNPRTRDKTFRFRTRRLSIEALDLDGKRLLPVVPTFRGKSYHSHSGTA
jgi:hypothetical protein